MNRIVTEILTHLPRLKNDCEIAVYEWTLYQEGNKIPNSPIVYTIGLGRLDDQPGIDIAIKDSRVVDTLKHRMGSFGKLAEKALKPQGAQKVLYSNGRAIRS